MSCEIELTDKKANIKQIVDEHVEATSAALDGLKLLYLPRRQVVVSVAQQDVGERGQACERRLQLV